MKDKNKFLYNATARIDETLIDELVSDGSKEKEAGKTSDADGKKSGVKIKTTVAAVIVVTLTAVALIIPLKNMIVPVVPVTVDTEGSAATEPFNGQAGDYSGAQFISLADTSVTARDVYKSTMDYFYARRSCREDAVKLAGFFDKLTQQLIDGKSNAVVSPVNIYLALSLLAETTGGTSRQQILDVIGVSSIEELREHSKIIWLCNSRNDIFGRSLLGNSIWLADGLSVKETCVDILKGDHYASSFAGDFADPEYKKALKQWLSDQTCGLIDGYVSKLEIPDDTLVALASTLYYKTKWYWQYDQTEEGVFRGENGDQNCVFNKKTVPQKSIYHRDGFDAFREELSDSNEMWFFLPDDGMTVEYVLSCDLVSFVNGNNNGMEYDVTVRMPDFDVGFNRFIQEDLKTLGITDCADAGKADFSSLTDASLYLDRVMHAARFKADKDGVEGAAFTVEYMSGGGPVDQKDFDFTLDKPFVFMVVNWGVPIFVGTVTDLN